MSSMPRIGAIRESKFEAPPGRWSHHSAAPLDDLDGAVVAYWEVRGELAPFQERVLPNGCIELMINLGPRHRLLQDARVTTWEHSWLSGIQQRALTIRSEEGTHLVAARLRPVGARELLGEIVPRSANRVIELGDVLGAGADELRRRLVDAPDPARRFELLDAMLRSRPREPAAPIVAESARRIEREHGKLRVSELHTELGVSRKHLAVSFQRAVGITAKAYAQLHRFAYTLARLQSAASVDWSALASDAGYADQSHMARDFRRIADANPTEFLRQRTPDGTALLVDEPR
jgi:AraC-like DNA-binding protein